jgi:hypothetical protein
MATHQKPRSKQATPEMSDAFMQRTVGNSGFRRELPEWNNPPVPLV